MNHIEDASVIFTIDVKFIDLINPAQLFEFLPAYCQRFSV